MESILRVFNDSFRVGVKLIKGVLLRANPFQNKKNISIIRIDKGQGSTRMSYDSIGYRDTFHSFY